MSTLRTIAERAAERNLPVILIGGHAVIAHGFQRNTFDLDLLAEASTRLQWTRLVQDLGYSVFAEREGFCQFSHRSGEGLPLDIMFVKEDTFLKMMSETIPVERAGRGVRTISLKHLFALKCHALKHTHPGRTIKDLDDVIRLIEINGVILNEPEWKELFLKYGTAEFYEKIRGITSQDRS